jgi:hypothetical protein
MYWEMWVVFISTYTWSLKKNVEIMVCDLPVAFITVHHYRDDNTLLWNTSQISVRYPVLRDVVEIFALATNNRLRYTLGSVTAFTILLLANILFVTSWRQFRIPK